MGKTNKGFTVIEMLIVIIILGIILVIAMPNFLNYYFQQRFYQEIQHIVASFRTAQFTSINTNHWIAIVIHPSCPYADGEICIQFLRLPYGRCALGVQNEPIWPPDWKSIVNCSNENINVLCEYKDQLWFAEKKFINTKNISTSETRVYIIGADGTITVQTKGEDNRVCSDLPIPTPQLQYTFSHKVSGAITINKGICISGRGNIFSTKPVENATPECNI